MSLELELQKLEKRGCYPVVSLRGHIKNKPVWRAHVNGAGNFWGEGSTPSLTLKRAVTSWKKAGWPMDGYGATHGH